ncbi:hypothetical protein, partial [Prevotellamassilia timonensis]|uniref:hypothetical protein n=1 Tax=Prevotellamassilia timonensis TaxID=1852370 RepID=UPI003FEDB33F
EMQVYLQSLPNRSLSYAKIVQGERRDASLLAIFAEPQPILCKDTTTNSVDMKNDFIFRSLHHLYSK